MITRLQYCLRNKNALAGQQIARLLSSSKFRQEAAASSTQTCKPAVVNSRRYKFAEGDVNNEFTCARVERVPEFNLTAYQFCHNRLGSKFIYIDRDDNNNVFSINFRTTPFDSTGLPHILEHAALCGSEKYPVRDPFFKMLNRSVATFMNAMTGADYTLYPFSSMNETDYRNLQKIYLDAVFKPNLSYLDFLQEGWRLEHTVLTDRKSPYTIKGVVYNEMKGAFSENNSLFSQHLLNSIVPDHTYGFVSGGNPLEIPKLKHQDLVAFHKKYYHPSNARFFSYGNFDVERTLSYINGTYLSGYNNVDDRYSQIPNQKRWNAHRNVHVSSRYDTMGAPFERQNMIAVALLMPDIANIYENFVLLVLSEVLIRGPNSYYYKSMIEPNFSGGYIQATGIHQHTKDTFFSLGLQDVRVEDFSRFQEIFDKTINEAIEKGFDRAHIDSILHNYELGLKHLTPQFGLGLLFGISPLWNHDGDVFDSLKLEQTIKMLRENLDKDPKYLQKRVECYFRENKHRLILTMSPDENYEKKFSEAEKKLLDEKVAKLSKEDRVRVYEDGLALDEQQKEPANTDLLPILSVDDVKKPPEPYSLRETEHTSVPTQIVSVLTNNIAYLKLKFEACHLSEEEIKLMPLFCSVVDDMGTKKYDFRTFDKIVKSKTSGINFNVNFAENIYDTSQYNIGVMTTVHALDGNAASMFQLLQELLTNYKMEDPDRLKMLLENYLSNLSVGIADGGHVYAMQSCSGLVTKAANLKSQLSSVEHIDFMKNLLSNNSPKEIMTALDRLGKKLFNTRNMKASINASEEILPSVIEKYERFVKSLPSQKNEARSHDCGLLEPSCLHYVMNIPVNFCAKSFLTVPYTHPDHPTLRVLAKFLSARYLLPVVREQNGAYGAGAKMGSDGIFNFFSYRDPNSTRTLDTFDNTYKWLTENSQIVTDQVLFEAKLGILQQLDAPSAPGNKGIEYFLYGISQEISNEYRQRMLNISRQQFLDVIEKYFKDPPKHYGKCVLGPENHELSQKESENWRVVGLNKC